MVAAAAGAVGGETKAVKIAMACDGSCHGDYVALTNEVVGGDAGAMEADPLTWLDEWIDVEPVPFEAMVGLSTMGSVVALAMVKASRGRVIVTWPYGREDTVPRLMGRRWHVMRRKLMPKSW